jgi:hypothetical protein
MFSAPEYSVPVGDALTNKPEEKYFRKFWHDISL